MPEQQQESGYVFCACRDCFDECVTADGGWTLCLSCLDAGCTPYTGQEVSPVEAECQREDAYGADDYVEPLWTEVEDDAHE